MDSNKFKAAWEYIQDLMDVRGDVIMMAYSSVMIARVALAAFGHASLTGAETAAYASAIGAFAYSNKGPK